MELLKAWNGNDKMFKTLLDKLKLESTREMENQSTRNDFQDVEEGIKTCPNCGDMNCDDYNFCVNCGFPLKRAYYRRPIQSKITEAIKNSIEPF